MLSWMALLLALWMPSARAAESPDSPVIRYGSGGMRFELADRAISPGTFARIVGDRDTLRAYNFAHKRMMLGCWTLWGMGAVLGGSGLVTLTMTPLADTPQAVGLAGLGVGAVGAISLASGFVAYAKGKERLNDPDTWYTPESAKLWLQACEEQARAPRIQVRRVFTGYGLALAGSF